MMLATALMVGGFIAACLLTWQGWRAARLHAEMADQAMREYAQVALWEYGRVAQWDLGVGVARRAYNGLSEINAHSAADPLPPIEVLRAAFEGGYPPFISGEVQTYFRYVIADGRVDVRGGLETEPTLPDLLVTALNGWLEHANEDAVRGVGFVLFPLDPVGLAAFGIREDARQEPVMMLGILIEPQQVDAVFERVLDEFAVLPPSITGGAENREVVSLEVIHPDQDVLIYRSHDTGVEGEVVEELLSPEFPGAKIRLAFRPEGRAVLLAGIPSGIQMPILFALLGITALFLGLAVMQLRREYAVIRLRSDFVSGVSHELRTPLSQIRMFAETLLLGRATTQRERTRSLEIIAEESRRLSHLIDNVLLFSKSRRSSDLTVTRTEMLLRPLVRDAVEAFVPLARVAGSEVRLVPGPDAMASVDAGLLRQALLNLLDNALKYGPAGETIRVFLEVEGREARIGVEDQGPGVPRKERDRIWEPFMRLRNDANRHIAGAGIGLAIVRTVASVHGGTVAVEDGAEGGARFTISLPTKSVSSRDGSMRGESVLDEEPAASMGGAR